MTVEVTKLEESHSGLELVGLHVIVVSAAFELSKESCAQS